MTPIETDASERAMEIARRFAQALDRGDYDAAGELLDAACVYEIRSERLEGREAILAAYRKNGEWAAKTFDEVTYESRVERGSDREALITFVDRIEHGGRRHVHTCQQSVEVDDRGVVCRISHRDLPGERQSLDDFLKAVGVTRQGGTG